MEIKSVTKRMKKKDTFWPFGMAADMVVCNSFDICMFILSRTAC